MDRYLIEDRRTPERHAHALSFQYWSSWRCEISQARENNSSRSVAYLLSPQAACELVVILNLKTCWNIETGAHPNQCLRELLTRCAVLVGPRNGILSHGVGHFNGWCYSSNVSFAAAGCCSACDCFKAAKARSFELMSSQRLKRAARESMRTKGTGCAVLDIAFNAEM